MNQALTSTQTFPIDNPKKLQGKPRPGAPSTHVKYQSRPKHVVNTNATFDLTTAVGPEILEPMPQFADQTVLVYTHVDMLAHHDHVPMGYMNRTNWIPQAEPLIYLPRKQWDEHQFMPQVEATGEWVDIVVNNIDDKGYPFHLVRTQLSSQLFKSKIFSLARIQFLRPGPPGFPPQSRLPNIQPLRSSFAQRSTIRASSLSETEYREPAIERYDSYPEKRICDIKDKSR